MRRLLSAVMLILFAVVAKGEPLWIKLDSLSAVPGTPEGVWRMASGTVFEIVPAAGRPGAYDLRLLFSADLSVPAGAYFGSMNAGGDSKTFDARLLADPKVKDAGGNARHRNFVVTFDKDFTHLTLRHYRKGLSVNFVRLVPYLFRVGIERHDDTPGGIIGARRCDAFSTDYPVRL